MIDYLNNMKRVVVTGIGLVTPLGVGAFNNWQKLIAGITATSAIKNEQFEKVPCKVGAFVPKGDGDGEFNVHNHFSKSECRKMTPATMYAMVATEEALEDSCILKNSELNREMMGVSIGTGMQDLEEIAIASNMVQNKYSSLSPYFIPKTLSNIAAGQVSIKYGLMGPNHAVATACATGCHAIGDAFRFIKYGDANVMVCGGTESNLSLLAIAGFCRIRALSTRFNENPSEASRPFDCDRDGFVMGEGAGILILEELEHAKNRKAKIYAEIIGYGMSGDGYHITSPREDGKGAYLAMHKAIAEAKINKEDIHYINAHATSTPIGDNIEVSAIKNVFQEHSYTLKVSSSKGAIGHLLGAAGAVESIYTVLACQSGQIPPTANLHNPSIGLDLDLVPLQSKSWAHINKNKIALCNSFGFGGTNASLCISSYEGNS